MFERVKFFIQSKTKRKLVITTLNNQYCDRDEVLLHAAFQILVNYIEKESFGKKQIFEVTESDRILDSLYSWWTEIRPQRTDPFDVSFEGVKKLPFEEMWEPSDRKGLMTFTPKTEEYKEYWAILHKASDIEDNYLKEDQEKLELLIEHRRAMWV